MLILNKTDNRAPCVPVNPYFYNNLLGSVNGTLSKSVQTADSSTLQSLLTVIVFISMEELKE